MKKIIALLFSLMIVFGLSACDNRPVLKMATNAEFNPFEYKEGNKFKGIDVELAQAIADELGYRLQIVHMEFASVITSVSSGQCDFAMAALTVSEDRREHVNFSDSYFNASQYLIVAKSNTAFDALADEATAADVEEIINGLGNNAKIGYQKGTTGQYYAKGDEEWGFAGFADADKTGYDNGAQALTELKNGRINMIIIDEMPARMIVESNSNDVKLIEIPLTEEEYAIGVKKGDAKLLADINAALAKIKSDGRFDEILDEYFLGK